MGRRGFLAARRSRNQTPPLLHRMEERAGERRGSPLSSVLSPLLCRGERKEKTARQKSSRPATIWTDTDTDGRPVAGLLPLRSPMDFVDGRLVGAFDEHFVNANVRRTAGDPDQGVGN